MGMAALVTVAAGVVCLLRFVVRLLYETVSYYWLTPMRIRRIMKKQGVGGPPPRFLVGNLLEMAAMVKRSTAGDMGCISHDVVGRLLPHFVAWSKAYGKRFIYWNGTEPRMCLTETEMIKELLSKYSTSSGKSWQQRQGSEHFIGRGLLMANGDEWYHRRHIVAPAFHGDKLKSYAGCMVECAEEMVETLRAAVAEKGETEVEIGEHMTRLTADIICRTEFGCGYEQGKQIFHLLTDLQRRCAQATRRFCFPGSRYLPSKYNREIKMRKAEVEKLLMKMIQSRRDGVVIGRSASHGSDLLGVLLNEMQRKESSDGDDDGGLCLNLQLIMDECKTFFFAGHETTALLLTWTVMLLATNQTWQEKVRLEITGICGENGALTVEDLPKFTALNMVINESLRLYPPASLLPRTAFEDIKLGDLHIPKGLSIWIPVLAIHHSKEIWGKDADEFNPGRFAAGSPRNFLPFAAGPRNCVGQSFALMEARIILAMLITKFRFTISPNYRHAPVIILTIKPQYGVQVCLTPL